MRLMIGAGGTGGHVYPALTVAHVLSQQNHNLTFVGTRGGGGFEKRLVEDSGLRFDVVAEIFAGPIVGVNPVRRLLSLLLMTVGLIQSLGLLIRHRRRAFCSPEDGPTCP